MKNQVVGQSGSIFGVRGGGLPDLRNYQKAGWITLVLRGCKFNSCAVDVSLTSRAALSKSKGWRQLSGRVWMVPIFKREFIDVTGITSPEPRVAVAEFTSPLGHRLTMERNWGAMPSDPETSTANFRLYDDGWRLVQ